MDYLSIADLLVSVWTDTQVLIPILVCSQTFLIIGSKDFFGAM